MTEFTESQKNTISATIAEMDRTHKITAFRNLMKARLWSAAGLALSAPVLIACWTGYFTLAGYGVVLLELILVLSLLLGLYSSKKLFSYTAKMQEVEAPLNELGLKYKPPGTGVEADGVGRSMPNSRGYLINKVNNTYVDITQFVS